MAQRARRTFTVKEFPNGQPWIHLEPASNASKIFANGILAFDLPRGTTRAEAERIAEYLNSKIVRVSYTPLPRRRR